MSYSALVEHFARVEDLPIPVDAVLTWIRENTDHKDLRLHPVERHKKAFRGAFRRWAVPTGKVYSHDFDVVCQVIYGMDLEPEWKRLVIVKEALHVFDPDGARVATREAVQRLIPSVITPELTYAPSVSDHMGAYRAMAVLLPRKARTKLKAALDAGSRTSTEIADYVQLPDFYVGIWLDFGAEFEPQLLRGA